MVVMPCVGWAYEFSSINIFLLIILFFLCFFYIILLILGAQLPSKQFSFFVTSLISS